MLEFNLLREIIESGNFDQDTGYEFEDTTCARLAAVLKSHKYGCGDLCGMLHNFITKARLSGDPDFKIKWSNALPDIKKIREDSYLHVITEKNHFFLGVKYSFLWKGLWIDNGTEFDKFYKACLLEKEASLYYPNLDNTKPVADYAVRHYTGYEKYNNEAQRTAVRSMFQMKDGETRLITLSTGGGKSLLFQLAALVNLEDRNLVLVIVPTVSLAKDHERSFRDLIKSNTYKDIGFAYTGELSTKEKKDFKTRIKNGDQPILFVSPESVLSSLLYSIKVANERGFLKYVFVDEAHIITDWGSNFRPGFQFLPALFARLKKEREGKTTFKTVLLTATLTPSSKKALDELFGLSIAHINGSDLRREIVFWKCKCADLKEKTSRLFDLLKFLPRPILIYDTRPIHIDNLVQQLRSEGYVRCEAYTGNTNDRQRDEILDKWHKNELDIIVANSAFGLGVSKGNVRSVIHFCVPESLDRFYQEVGRSGRDGKIAISFMLFSNFDIRQGKMMNNPQLITDQLASQRWFAMKNTTKNNEYPLELDIRTVPLHGNEDNDEQRLWNKRTLILMARAGMIEIDFRLPDFSVQIFADEGKEISLDYIYKLYVSTIYHEFVNQKGHDLFNAARDYEIKRADFQFAKFLELLNGKIHHGEAFGSLYNLGQNYFSCLSCPKCREVVRLNRIGTEQVRPLTIGSDEVTQFVYFHYDMSMNDFETSLSRVILNALYYLFIKYDVKEYFVTIPHFKPEKVFENFYDERPPFLITRGESEDENLLYDEFCNRISFVKNQLEFEKVREIERPTHIIIFPGGLKDSDTNELFRNILGSENFSNLIKELP